MSLGIQASFLKRFAGGPEIRIENLHTSDSGGITVLFGASGAGKTTVLRCLAGLEQPEQGIVRFGSEVWSDAARKIFVAPRRRHIGFVPQEYALFPHLSIRNNVGYGLHDIPAAERLGRIGSTLRWLGLEGLEHRVPSELSGGQQQRVALARAVAGRPRLLLLDEPLAALDAPTRLRLRAELRPLLSQLGIPCVLVTHERAEALALGDQLFVLDQGRIVQQGPVHEVFSRPANLAAAGIVAVETVQPGHVLETGELVTVAVGERRLSALAPGLPARTDAVYVCIRAEDVILMKGPAPPSSPRNCLPAVVRALNREGAVVRVELDCGFPLTALLTKQACEELALAPNEPVLALVKAPHIHLIPRS